MRVMVMVKAVIKPARKRRLHANAALARNEPGSAYVPNRQLWIREARRHYVPNRALRVRVAGPDGGDAWVPPHEVMNLSWHESHLDRKAGWRLVEAVPAVQAAG